MQLTEPEMGYERQACIGQGLWKDPPGTPVRLRGKGDERSAGFFKLRGLGCVVPLLRCRRRDWGGP